MKNHPLHLSIFVFFVLILSSSCTYSYPLYDSTENDDPANYPVFNAKDLGTMFNERGYYKSNASSYDEKEIINDFNGNLMYSIPLAKGKGKGDLSYDFSLNYNGNVNYQIINCDAGALSTLGGQVHRYNFTAPGWILSFNGFAIQMLNFESSFFTRPGNYNEVEGRYVNLVAPGYNFSGTFTTSEGANDRDRITIMLGDGSTETLENISGQQYTGTYKSTSITSYTLGKVFFLSQAHTGIGDLRKMYLMKGDGLTYYFEEQYVQYKDYYQLSGPGWLWPKVFMLKMAKDRFGHEYFLTYEKDGVVGGVNTKIGRPWFTNGPGLTLDYGELPGFNINIGIRALTIDGYYIFHTDFFGPDIGMEHRPGLRKIVNPLGQEMTFSYDHYSRKGLNLYKDPDHFFKFNMNPGNGGGINRLSGVTTFDGGVRTYSYLSAGADLGYMDYNVETGIAAGSHSDHAYYYGMGRDLYFANMIEDVTVKDGSNSIRQEHFHYDYNHSGREWTDVWLAPVDSIDNYITKRTVSSLGSTDNSTASSKSSSKLYKNYRIKQQVTEIREYEGTTKLISDTKYEGESSTAYEVTTYDYYMGTPDVHQVFGGSFLEKYITETFGSVSRLSTREYGYSGNQQFDPLTYKTETDPFGKSSKTYFHAPFINDHFTVFKDGGFPVIPAFAGETSSLDSTYFYLIHQPDSIVVTNGSTRLAKQSFEYYNPTSVTNSGIDNPTYGVDGYPGELKTQKTVDPVNESNYLTTSYKYYSQDTTARGIWANVNFNFISMEEGNLKEITDPKGNKKMYYYEALTRAEDESWAGCTNDNSACTPKISYHVMKMDGGEDVISTEFRDFRMPTRIDSYIDGTRYLSNYQSYNEAGNPAFIVDNNKFFSQVDYGYHQRLDVATLPYDFSDNYNIDVTHHPNDISTKVKLVVNSEYWGFIDETTNNYCGDQIPQTYDLTNDMSSLYTSSGFKVTKIVGSNDLPADVRKTAIAFFDHTKGIDKITEIDSAFLEIAPFKVLAKANNQVTSNYNFVIRPFKHLENSAHNCGYQSAYSELLFTKDSHTATFNSPGFSTLDDCVNDDSVVTDKYLSRMKRFNITDLLKSCKTDSLELQGLDFDLEYPNNWTSLDLELYLYGCESSEWKSLIAPRLTIYGTSTIKDTINTLTYHRGTMIYNYNDASNEVTVQNRIDNSRLKKTEYYFDHLRRLKDTRLYTASNSYNSFQTAYNYLDQKSSSTDAAGNQTKYSYDEFGNLNRTVNPIYNDTAGYTATLNTYQSSFSYTYGTLDFINKQVFTDETGRTFEKYIDAAGNLRREVKYVAQGGAPNAPFDPDTTIGGLDAPSMTSLVTDYKYDALYRVTEVKTPGGRHIYYSYDNLGRQIIRTTDDAGIVKFGYDKNNNLILSQDANQRAVDANLFTGRTYDGLNRLLTIGDKKLYNPNGGTDMFGDTTLPNDFDNMGTADSLFIINVYDTVTSAPVSGVFTSLPSGYNSEAKYTKGNLVATAYRTNLADSWNFKYYKYDARGKVVRLWSYLAGLGWKTIDNRYNSSNQVTAQWYQPNQSDGKFYSYLYDDAARLKSASLYLGSSSQPPDEGDSPGNYLNLAGYTYNANSQIQNLYLSNNNINMAYTYNSRNWVQTLSNEGIFTYLLRYNQNGTIREQDIGGTYKDNFTDNSTVLHNLYIYDNSNRLLVSKILNTTDTKYNIANSYDGDGNLLTLNRYATHNTSIDNFSYGYYSNTNKLKFVTGSTQQYTYDNNGNLTGDSLNHLYDFKYDYRNLLTEFKRVETGSGIFGPETYYDKTNYFYDEAGNRILKMNYRFNQSGPPNGENDSPGNWTLQNKTYYVRDVGSKELALYDGTTLTQWNMYGLDNIGKINADTTKYYYLKDHLGTIRAVVNSTNTVVSAGDYDAWGYPLQNRSYQSDNTKYKFTGKERDKESGLNSGEGYDYFGARYYNNRVAGWTSIDPLFEKHYSYTPYNYVLGNPTRLVDPDGKQADALYINIGATTDPLQAKAEIQPWRDEKGHTDIEFRSEETHENAGIYPTNIEIDLATLFAPVGLSLRVGEEVEASSSAYSIKNIIENPYSLYGKDPQMIKSLSSEENWIVTGLGKGSTTPLKSEGFVLRELNATGNRTGTMIQYHPGLGIHGMFPYFKFSSSKTGILKMGANFIKSASRQIEAKSLGGDTFSPLTKGF